MALAGVTPPGTLAVVPGHFNTSTLTSLPSFNWSSPNWIHISNMTPLPAPKVLTLAMQAAESMQIVPINPPSTNTSYSLHFYGPACDVSMLMIRTNIRILFFGTIEWWRDDYDTVNFSN